MKILRLAGRVRGRRARDAGEEDRQHDVDLRQAAREMPDQVARQPHQPIGDAADVHQVGGQQEERHREQDERVVGVEGLLHEHHRRQPRLDEQDRQAGEPERERDRHAQDHQDEEHAEQDRALASPGDEDRCRRSLRRAPVARSPGCAGRRRTARRRNTIQVTPASGQAMWMSHSGSSASSEMRFQANCGELDARTRRTPARRPARRRCDTMPQQRVGARRRAAARRRPRNACPRACRPSRRS